MKAIKITSFLAFLFISNILFAQTKTNISDFVGCWITPFERCLEPNGTQKMTIVPLETGELIGYYATGGGYLRGKLTGNVWSGMWHSSNCGEAWCEGTFYFKLIGKNEFKGNYSINPNCPNKASVCPEKKTTFWWNGKKEV